LFSLFLPLRAQTEIFTLWQIQRMLQKFANLEELLRAVFSTLAKHSFYEMRCLYERRKVWYTAATPHSERVSDFDQ
jgi:hypothetical protein